jgi:hypothetical protein
VTVVPAWLKQYQPPGNSLVRAYVTELVNEANVGNVRIPKEGSEHNCEYIVG